MTRSPLNSRCAAGAAGNGSSSTGPDRLRVRKPATQPIVLDASRSSAATASSRCSSRVSSSLVCDRPRRLCTNIITVGTPARETSAASCSGPDGSRCDAPATSRIASSQSPINVSSKRIGSMLQIRSQPTSMSSSSANCRESACARSSMSASFAASRCRWSRSCSAVSTTDVTMPGLHTTPPDVHTAPSPVSRAMSRIASASLAAPARASRRRSIGVEPACAA